MDRDFANRVFQGEEHGARRLWIVRSHERKERTILHVAEHVHVVIDRKHSKRKLARV